MTLATNNRKEYFPIFFMFLSLANMLLCLAFISFTEGFLVYMLCVVAYGCLVFLEISHGIKSPVTLSLLCIYTAFMFLSLFDFELNGYAGIIVFAWLSMSILLLLIFGKPFTIFYSKGKGMKALHVANSAVWLSAFFISLLSSLYFIPGELFIIIPYVICCFAGCLTLLLNLVWFGSKYIPQKVFSRGVFTFRHISHLSKDFDIFCSFFAQQMVNDPTAIGITLGHESVTRLVKKSELELGSRSKIICVFNGEKIIGCVRCILHQHNAIFPLEENIKQSFSSLKQVGKFMQIGRLAVDAKFRERPDVLSGLFKGITDLALKKDVHFFVGDAAKNRLSLYFKLGFNMLFPRNDPRSTILLNYGVECTPVFLNFAQLIFESKNEIHEKYGLSEYVNRYLVERWYKRAVLKNHFRPISRWPWLYGIDDVRKLLQNDIQEVTHA